MEQKMAHIVVSYLRNTILSSSSFNSALNVIILGLQCARTWFNMIYCLINMHADLKWKTMLMARLAIV